jgi:lipopolysaccharide/colanic/teichoic acid biosynthesis glycosyltransferase
VRGKRASRLAKWCIDRIAALVLMLLSAPVTVMIVVAILIDDGRPVLFVQRRAGRDGRPFPMLKFRSMIRGAISEHKLVTEDPFGVVRDDPRITATGRFLRRTGLDELPQLLNVLVSQMSLVGPRPDVLEQVANYSQEDRRRLAVRPGITGWAQVRGRDEIEWPERIALDVWYIDHWSLLLDAKILLFTAWQPFRADPDPVPDTMNIERARRRHRD